MLVDFFHFAEIGLMNLRFKVGCHFSTELPVRSSSIPFICSLSLSLITFQSRIRPLGHLGEILSSGIESMHVLL